MAAGSAPPRWSNSIKRALVAEGRNGGANINAMVTHVVIAIRMFMRFTPTRPNM
jgi:hypothetical protein